MKHLAMTLARFFLNIASNLEHGLSWDTNITWTDKLAVSLIVLSILTIGGLLGVAYCSIQQAISNRLLIKRQI